MAGNLRSFVPFLWPISRGFSATFRMRELGYEGELYLLFEEGNGGL